MYLGALVLVIIWKALQHYLKKYVSIWQQGVQVLSCLLLSQDMLFYVCHTCRVYHQSARGLGLTLVAALSLFWLDPRLQSLLILSECCAHVAFLNLLTFILPM